MIYYKLDTAEVVRFYEQEFYVLSNFSAFRLKWNDVDFDTSEHAYHWVKFDTLEEGIDRDMKAAREEARFQILHSRSAHDAYKTAQEHKLFRRADWDEIKLGIMKDILHAKVAQHPYIKKKLLETGDRLLIEDSWRDDFWGWGPNKDGQNMLGKLWMEVRKEIR